MPQLIVIENGEKRTVSLSEPTTTIGRSPDSGVVIDDRRSSRRHCQIERCPEGFRVVDVGSQNGTYVNGSLVARKTLRPGDRIDIGAARIFFEREYPGDPLADPSQTQLGLASPETEAKPANLDALKKERGNLLRLQRINRALNSELDRERLLEIIIDSAVELTDAERGFLILMEGGKLDFAVARNFQEESIEAPEGSVSWSIAERVFRTGEAVVAVNASEDERFRAVSSVETLGLRSILSVPLRVHDKVVGTLYLDNRLHKNVFGEDDLHLLEAFADQAAIALENSRLYLDLRTKAAEVQRLAEELSRRVEVQAVELDETRDRLRSTQAEVERKYSYKNIVGTSPRMRQVFRLLDKVIATDVPVLIQGESGTGKELVAKAIHYNGARQKAKFVSENCAALPESLLESELFGYAKGAFTGALKNKKGLFEVASGGTLFLDEVSNMSGEMQKKFLRVLQERRVRPVGGQDEIPVDVRLLSASNQDLKAQVAKGEFREDLYYRLQVVTVQLPPLRERREDVPLLAKHFLDLHCRTLHSGRKIMSPEVLAAFMGYDWPGNVRELENEVKRAIALADDIITLDVVSPHVREGSRSAGAAPVPLAPLPPSAGGFRDLTRLVEDVERSEIGRAMDEARRNKTKAAALLGISRFTLQRKLAKYAFPEAEKGDTDSDADEEAEAEPAGGGRPSATEEGPE